MMYELMKRLCLIFILNFINYLVKEMVSWVVWGFVMLVTRDEIFNETEILETII
jgi:hypothetical protein